MKPHPGPLCVNCRWFWPRSESCRRLYSATPSPVTGLDVRELFVPARFERRSNFTLFGRPKCGPDGKHFLEGRFTGPPPPPPVR